VLLLVGLGNPTKEYMQNRHNVGYMVLDQLAAAYALAPYKNKFSGKFTSGFIATQKIILFKPATYMNNSGICLRDLVNFYQIKLDNIIVFHDDLDLPVAKMKLKKAGGSAGHNGIKSIDQHVGGDYWRLRIGIGHPIYKEQVASYVLSDFNAPEKEMINQSINLISNHVTELFGANRNLFMDKIYGI
jgi:PTH1 family peptidyl-tRNA hydrolase